MQRFLITKIWIVLIFSATSCPAQTQSAMHLELLGQETIPYNYSFKDTPVGGLSGLTYDPNTQTYYVISDDRSELAAARFYSFKLHLDEHQKLNEGGIQFEDVVYLNNSETNEYGKGRIDPEGIAVNRDSLIYISSEGIPSLNIAPFVNVYSKMGAYEHSFTIPKAYWAAKAESRSEHGVRVNFGFEGLGISPDKTKLYAATENALMQDGPAADSSSGSPARIIVYDLPSGDILHEYCYQVDAVNVLPGERGALAVNGLTDVVVLDEDGNLLTIDRNYVAKQGASISLYHVSTKKATDIKGMPAMPQNDQFVRPVDKTLVANLSDYDITLDNFEGLVLGPELPGGGRLLLMVSDNNFSQIQQTLFTAFRLHAE